ncbi:ImmA/IrrE family metallo-endopeptidase [Nocardia sp. NPDC059177]|uniref:ImmA/IrrE family metallo-endopeptidase n=1 Tax=Nocardia sp. NPDC059177 TaxID=3346759 RepID=UPI003679AA62
MSTEYEGKQAAARFRADNKLGSAPLGDLVTLIEQFVGADVAVVDTEPDQHGMTMRRGIDGPVYVAVARTPHPMRQRSTLAHELAHIVFGDWSDNPQIDSAAPVESRANAFARHLLIPQQGVRDMVAGEYVGSGRAMLSAVVQRFLVSPRIAAIALEQAGSIDAATKSQWKSISTPNLAAEFGWLDRYQSLARESDRRRPPQRLLARAISGWLQNAVSIQTIATLRGSDAGTVERELRAAGLEPAESTVAPAWAAAAELPKVAFDLSEFDADLDDGDTQ